MEECYRKRGGMEMSVFGYARVSSKDQNLGRQIRELQEFGIEEKYIFIDQKSGKDFNRPAYNTLIGTDKTVPLMREGDLLVITSIDRLGRNYEEIQREWKRITKELNIDIKVLDMPLLDTRGKKEDNLDRTFVADLVLQILSYVAEKERENIRSRQKQGLDAMPVRDGKKYSLRTGKAIGRPEARYPENWRSLYQDWKDGKITAVMAMELLGLKKTTFYKLAKEYKQMEIK